MKILAISGCARETSTNTALLQEIKRRSPEEIQVQIFDQVKLLPIFSPDLEGEMTPSVVLEFINLVLEADGIIISSPEYIRSIPGGLKNAIDWMVSRFEIIGKPIALVHASHRGDDMLASLRLVLSTVSSGFNEDIFLRVPLVGKTQTDVERFIREEGYEAKILMFLKDFYHFSMTIKE